jgi:hypothetical protein
MLNLFGVPVPDNVAAAFLAAAANKRQEEAKEAYKPADLSGKKEAPDMESKAKKSADTAKKFFDAYLAEGFSRSEALELTKGNLNTKF